MKQKYLSIFLIVFSILTEFINCSTTLTSNKIEAIDGYSYELWKESDNTYMQLLGGGKFSCSWININNALFRIGKKFDCTKTWKQLGTITVKYKVDYKPNGNSYLCVYG